jgi:hypothetical protein
MTATANSFFRAVKLLLGISEEEKELKEKFKEAVRQKKDETMSIAEAREKLEKAHLDLHARTTKIRGKLDSQHDAEDRRSSPSNPKPVGST